MILAQEGLADKRTPYQVELARACGESHPVVESHIPTLLSRGVGRLRYRGSEGARIQLGMIVMPHNGAAVVQINQQRSQSAPKRSDKNDA